jgi:hypothetical protein
MVVKYKPGKLGDGIHYFFEQEKSDYYNLQNEYEEGMMSANRGLNRDVVMYASNAVARTSMIARTAFYALFSLSYMNNFPYSLPTIIQEKLESRFSLVKAKGSSINNEMIAKVQSGELSGARLLYESDLDLAVAELIGINEDIGIIKFETLILSNSLVSVIGYFENFIDDTIKLINKYNRKLWLEYESNGFNHKTSWLKKLCFLVEKLDIKFPSVWVWENWIYSNYEDNNQYAIDRLNHAINVRHIYVHNFGKVDDIFISNTGDVSAESGEYYLFDRRYLLGTTSIMSWLINRIAESIMALIPQEIS